jgi:hypothetical protein
VEGQPIAFLTWYEDSRQFMAEFVDFTPAITREIYDLAGKRIEFPYGKDQT